MVMLISPLYGSRWSRRNSPINSQFRRGFATSLLGLVALCVTGLPLLGQGTSSIRGRIVDPLSNVVPAAVVTSINEETGTTRTTVAGEGGIYHLVDLLPGDYRVHAEHPGFKQAIRSAVRLESTTILTLDIELELGDVTESIEVAGQLPQVETADVRISDVVTETELRSLPLLGRGIMNLASMSPGVTSKAERASWCCDAFSVYATPLLKSGGNDLKSDFTLDGTTLRYSSGSYWGALFSPNADAVAEVRVSNSPYAAEFGRTSGALVQMVTKGGTNQFHGTAHYTAEESALAANPFFNPNAPDTYRRYFGGTTGGPLIKDQLFFFVGFEGLREQSSAAGQSVVETQKFYDFVQRERPGSVAAALLGKFPPKSFPSSSLSGNPNLGLTPITDPSLRSGEQYNARFDHQTSSGSDRLYGSYWRTRAGAQRAHVRTGFDNFRDNLTHSVRLGQTHTFGPSTLSDFRFATARLTFDAGSKDPEAYIVPRVVVNEGLSLGNGAWSKEQQVLRSWEVSEIINVIRGRHSMKFGGGYRRAINDNTHPAAAIPTYRFGTLLDFANDDPFQETRSINVETGLSQARRRFSVLQETHFFVQDTWQVSQRLTVNYGLRWENFYSVSLRKVDIWSPIVSSNQLNPQGIAQIVNSPVDRVWEPGYTNFGPRLSFAWDPTGNRKLAFRAGVAVLYDELTSGPTNVAEANPPTAATVNLGPQFDLPIVYGLGVVDPNGCGPSQLACLFRAGEQPNPSYPANPAIQTPGLTPEGAVQGLRSSIGGAIRDLENPMVLNVTVGFQYQPLDDLVLELDYRHRQTSSEMIQTNWNRLSGGSARWIHRSYQSGVREYHSGLESRKTHLPRDYCFGQETL